MAAREKLLGRFFKEYCKFFYYENQVALFEGRNYKLIYAFYSTLSTLRAKESTSKQWMGKLNGLSELVDDFIVCSKSMYPFLKKDTNCCEFTKDIKFDLIVDLFNKKTSDMFDEFYKAYTVVTIYKNVNIINEMLIEFNNYLSHFVKYIDDQTLATGTSHLYRGCLDGYKDILLENNILILSDTILRDRFIDLRIQECSTVGTKETDKLDILCGNNGYRQISEDILSMSNC